MLKNMFHPWGNRLYPNRRMTVYWKIWQPSSSERVAVNISKIITTELWSCYALVYGKGRGLRLIHWSPNRYDKDNSLRRGNFLCLKRQDGERGGDDSEWNVCVCCSVRHRTWVSPFTMHRTITTDLSQREVSSSSTSFSHKTRVVHPQGRVYFESRGCNGPLSPWLDPRNVWVSVGCSGQGVWRESGWLIEPALGGGSGGEVLVHLSAFPILIRAPPISLWQ